MESRPVNITHVRLKEVLYYCLKTGLFLWTKPPSVRVKVGDVAGHLTSYGYQSISVDGRKYQAHRLAWFYVYGKWPEFFIDHIDGDRLNNRIENLRDTTRRTNNQNVRSAQVDSESGLLGAYWDKDREVWFSSIKIMGKTKALGRFPTKEAAHQAYVTAKRIHHAGCTI